MSQFTFVPFGARCRIAYQTRRFNNLHKIVTKGYPFDQSLTPIKALETLVSPLFDFNKLKPIRQKGFLKENGEKVTNLRVHDITHKEGIIPDKYTGAIFIHEANLETQRSRFLHTYNNFKALSNSKEKKILIRSSDNDVFGDWENYFGDTNPSFDTLLNNLKTFFTNGNFTFVDVCSKYSSDVSKNGSFRILEEKEHFIKYELIEYDYIRDGRNLHHHQQPQQHQGDDQAWNNVLNDIIKKQSTAGISR